MANKQSIVRATINGARLSNKQKAAFAAGQLATISLYRASLDMGGASGTVMGIMVGLIDAGFTPAAIPAALDAMRGEAYATLKLDAKSADKNAVSGYFSMAKDIGANLNRQVTTGAADKGGAVTKALSAHLYRTNKKGEQTGLSSLRGVWNILQDAKRAALPAAKRKELDAEKAEGAKTSRRTFVKGYLTNTAGNSLIAKTERAILEVIGAAIVQAVEKKEPKTESALREMLHEFEAEYGIKLN